MNPYSIVTDRILEKLESGVIPWRQRWSVALPKSLTTGREYRGINFLLLNGSGFSSRYWITYREAQRIGGQVKAGEKGLPVVYWHWRTEVEIAKLIASGKTNDPAPCIPFISTVFNLDQVEGVTRPSDDVELLGEGRLERADATYQQMTRRPLITHELAGRPAYNWSLDRIRMPFIDQFESRDLYYSTLFHELTHATGHESRLARFGTKEEERGNDRGYSFEELVAEFGAAFLCGITGIESLAVVEESASYIAEWSKVFRQDKSLILKAASAAQRAVDYIRGEFLVPATQERAAA